MNSCEVWAVTGLDVNQKVFWICFLDMVLDMVLVFYRVSGTPASSQECENLVATLLGAAARQKPMVLELGKAPSPCGEVAS